MFNIEALESTKDENQKYRVIIQYAQTLGQNDDVREPKYLVPGCEAKVWLRTRLQDHCYKFDIDSESKIILGLAAIFLLQLDGKDKTFIQEFDGQSFLRSIGLEKRLTPSRSNGFLKIVQRVKQLAE